MLKTREHWKWENPQLTERKMTNLGMGGGDVSYQRVLHKAALEVSWALELKPKTNTQVSNLTINEPSSTLTLRR